MISITAPGCVPGWVYEGLFPQADEDKLDSLAATWHAQGQACTRDAETLSTAFRRLTGTWSGTDALAAVARASSISSLLTTTGRACQALGTGTASASQGVRATKLAMNLVLLKLGETTLALIAAGSVSPATYEVAAVQIRAVQLAAYAILKSYEQALIEHLSGIRFPADIQPRVPGMSGTAAAASLVYSGGAGVSALAGGAALPAAFGTALGAGAAGTAAAGTTALFPPDTSVDTAALAGAAEHARLQSTAGTPSPDAAAAASWLNGAGAKVLGVDRAKTEESASLTDPQAGVPGSATIADIFGKAVEQSGGALGAAGDDGSSGTMSAGAVGALPDTRTPDGRSAALQQSATSGFESSAQNRLDALFTKSPTPPRDASGSSSVFVRDDEPKKSGFSADDTATQGRSPSPSSSSLWTSHAPAGSSQPPGGGATHQGGPAASPGPSGGTQGGSSHGDGSSHGTPGSATGHAGGSGGSLDGSAGTGSVSGGTPSGTSSAGTTATAPAPSWSGPDAGNSGASIGNPGAPLTGGSSGGGGSTTGFITPVGGASTPIAGAPSAGINLTSGQYLGGSSSLPGTGNIAPGQNLAAATPSPSGGSGQGSTSGPIPPAQAVGSGGNAVGRGQTGQSAILPPVGEGGSGSSSATASGKGDIANQVGEAILGAGITAAALTPLLGALHDLRLRIHPNRTLLQPTQFGARDLLLAPLPADMSVVFQKVLAPGEGDAMVAGTVRTLRGLVYPRSQVAHLTTPANLFDALGLGYALELPNGEQTRAFDRAAESIEVLRCNGVRQRDLIIPLDAGVERPDVGFLTALRDHARPWQGTGEAVGSTAERPIEEFEVLGTTSLAIPHLSEIWRMEADGSEHHVATYNARSGIWSSSTGEVTVPPGRRVDNGLYAVMPDGVGYETVTLTQTHSVLVAHGATAPEQFLACLDGSRRLVVGNGQISDLVGVSSLATWRGATVHLLYRYGDSVLVDYADVPRALALSLGFGHIAQGHWLPQWVSFGELTHVRETERTYPVPGRSSGSSA
jgi:hypothetical protein